MYKLCSVNTHNMVEGYFSHLFLFFSLFFANTDRNWHNKEAEGNKSIHLKQARSANFYH